MTALNFAWRHRTLVIVLVACLVAGAVGSAALGETKSSETSVAAAGTINGQGSKVVSIRLTRNSPLVVTAVHNGSSNFIVELVGASTDEGLFNEIGAYRGQTAAADITAGRYRVAIRADGSWTLAFAQPTPTRSAKPIPGAISGSGARVIAVRSTRSMRPVVTGTHRGASNFIVHLIGYGTTMGEENLFNEIGNYRGQTLMDSRIPKGPYLLHVQADEAWTIRFAP